MLLPSGFACHVASIGVKDGTDDFAVVAADRPCAAAGLFTRSRFAGPSVTISQGHLTDGRAHAVVVLSKNANVANGPAGDADAADVVAGVASAIGANPSDVLIASTGVIGRRYPMDRVAAGIAALPGRLNGRDARRVAAAMMTTDTVAKVAEAEVGDGPARVVGVAKGVGMIEPDMATLIALAFTDAAADPAELRARWGRVVSRTFNCLSIDTDTSTSDTAIVMASGAAGEVDGGDLEAALHTVALSLTLQIARDGEGATKLLEVTVDRAANHDQAKRVAKLIVNSPLVKTAVHGADPNWGRVAMAIGKASDDHDIHQDRVVIRFGATEVYPAGLDDAGLVELARHMAGSDVRIHASLGTGSASATVWGCDLSEGYVRINADYTT